MDLHFAPSFRQRVDGRWADRAEFVAGVVSMRATVEHAAITVLDELADGALYADRHLVDLLGRDGERMRQEVYVFAERDAEGRFLRIEEATVKAAG